MNLNKAAVVERPFLNMVNAANLAGLSLRHFRRIIKDNPIRRIKIGRRFFVISADLQRWKVEKSIAVAELDDDNSREFPDK